MAVLDGVDEQRLETIEILRAERQVVLDAVDDDVEQALATLPTQIEEGIDLFWRRAIQIGGAGLALAGIAAFFASRHLIDRARRADLA